MSFPVVWQDRVPERRIPGHYVSRGTQYVFPDGKSFFENTTEHGLFIYVVENYIVATSPVNVPLYLNEEQRLFFIEMYPGNIVTTQAGAQKTWAMGQTLSFSLRTGEYVGVVT